MKRNHTSKTISTLLLLLFDFLTVSVSFYLALLVRFDFKYSQIESAYIDKLPAVCIVASVVAISVYFLCQLYNMIWNYFSVNEIGRLSIAVIVSNFAIVSVTWAVFGRYPWSVYCMSFMMQFIFALLSRGSFRIVNFI